MLFSVKNRLLATLSLWLAFTAGALLARQWLGLTWSFAFALGPVLAGLGAVAASDGLLHGLLRSLLGERYLARYRLLAFHFRRQGTAEIVAGGILATGEELLFRGIILEGIMNGLGWGAPAGVVLSALAFGACHVIAEQELAPFALWAVWEGALLGTVYVLSGSLLVAMLVHGLHDAGGFALFAVQRRTGWLLSEGVSG